MSSYANSRAGEKRALPWIVERGDSLICARCRAEKELPGFKEYLARGNHDHTAMTKRERSKFRKQHANCERPAPVNGRCPPGRAPSGQWIDDEASARPNPHASGRGLPCSGGFGRANDGRRI